MQGGRERRRAGGGGAARRMLTICHSMIGITGGSHFLPTTGHGRLPGLHPPYLGRVATTLKDIAERAGVSQAAVSIAMGSKGRIADATRKKILAIADELNYRPNLLVQGMQSGRTKSIGVLMEFGGVFESGLFHGVHQVLAPAGYVPYVLLPAREVPVLEQIHALLDRRVDGILMRPTGEARWERHLHEALDRHVPVVSIDVETQADTPKVDFVGTDDAGGARAAAAAFLKAGHRHAAVLTTGDELTPMRIRTEAFAAAFRQRSGATCTVSHQPWGDEIDGHPVAQELLAASPRPTAVFTTMDRLAAGVYRAAAERGLSIPGDVSVIGFSNDVVGRLLAPQLSTIAQNPEEIGRVGARILLDRIEGGDAHSKRKHRRTKTHLIERGSVGPVGPAPTGS